MDPSDKATIKRYLGQFRKPELERGLAAPKEEMLLTGMVSDSRGY